MNAGQSDVTGAGPQLPGQSARQSSLAALTALSDAVESTLGPKGLDKLLVSGDSSSYITNDGSVVLDRADIHHPAAQIIASLIKHHATSIGEGTSDILVLSGNLARAIQPLLRQGIHPVIIQRNLRSLADELRLILPQIQRPFDPVDDLEMLVSTTLRGLTNPSLSGALVKIISSWYTTHNIKHPFQGSRSRIRIDESVDDLSDPKFIRGTILNKDVLNTQGRLIERERGTVLLLDGGLEHGFTSLEVKFLVQDPLALNDMKKYEFSAIDLEISRLKSMGVDLLVVRDGIHDDARDLLRKQNILAIRRVESDDFSHIAHVSGATPVSRIENATIDDLGIFEKLVTSKRGNSVHTQLIGAAETDAGTILIPRSNRNLYHDLSRNIKRALARIESISSNPYLIPDDGIGLAWLSIEMADATDDDGRDAMVRAAFIAALESITSTISRNAGVDSTYLIDSVRSALQKEKSLWGEAIDQEFLPNIPSIPVMPVSILEEIIFGAVECTVRALRVDDIVLIEGEEQEGVA